jgi:hypothetical protein
MRTSLIGLVSRFGLESVMTESDATREWLLQAAHKYPLACVWATLQRGTAVEIRELLAAGESCRALRHMAHAAESFGSVGQR